MKRELSIMGGMDLVNNIETSLNKEVKKEFDIVNAIEAKGFIKFHLNENGIKVKKLAFLKQHDKFIVSYEFSGRIYMETYTDLSLKEITVKTLKNIEKVLKDIHEIIPQTSNRKQRRGFLHNSKYFTNKKSLSYNEWNNLINHNILKGKDAHDKYTTECIKSNVNFLLYREQNFRKQLVNLSKEKVDSLIERWYATLIKENSFLTEK